MSNISKVEKAHQRRKQFLEAHGISRLVEIKLLYSMWKYNDFKELGFSSFKEFMEAPRNSGGLDISRSWAIQLIKVYQRYVIELGMNEKKLLDISPRKLYLLKGKAKKSNLNTVLSEAENISLHDLQLEKDNIDTVNCQHDLEKWGKCRKCKAWVKQEE